MNRPANCTLQQQSLSAVHVHDAVYCARRYCLQQMIPSSANGRDRGYEPLTCNPTLQCCSVRVPMSAIYSTQPAHGLQYHLAQKGPHAPPCCWRCLGA